MFSSARKVGIVSCKLQAFNYVQERDQEALLGSKEFLQFCTDQYQSISSLIQKQFLILYLFQFPI